MPQFLDSPAPFNPINPHGARAKMPPGWTSPLRTPLYAVVVDMKGEDKPVVVSPGMIQECAEMVCQAAREAIKTGIRTEWANPSIVLCHI